MKPETEKVLRLGLDIGVQRYVAHLMQNYLSDPKTVENFARGLERAAEGYERATQLVDELFVEEA